MNKTILVVLGLILVILVIALASGDVRNPVSPTQGDELTGTWNAKAPDGAEYAWFVTYLFDGKGTYSMHTDSAYKEDGTYTIVERRESGLLLVHKTYGTPEQPKEYDMEVMLDPEGKTIAIEGMVLTKQ